MVDNSRVKLPLYMLRVRAGARTHAPAPASAPAHYPAMKRAAKVQKNAIGAVQRSLRWVDTVELFP